jgi:arabinogalactan endo-1,4-beta-galactosidase
VANGNRRLNVRRQAVQNLIGILRAIISSRGIRIREYFIAGWLIALSLSTGVVSAATPVVPGRPPFLAGSDVSYFGYIESHGGVYRYGNRPVGLLNAFKQAGCNTLRLRLFHRPTPAEVKKYGKLNTLNDLAYTLPLAEKIVHAGFYFVLDMHFSDTWADPGHQLTPATWRKLPFPALKARLRAYCFRVITAFKRHHALPKMVLVGNEINNGILWPRGRLWVDHRARWNRLAALLNAAIAGIHSAAGSHKPLLMIQVAGFNYAPTFYRQLLRRGVHFNVVGFDYYPYWQGPLKNLRTNLYAVARAVHKPIIVAETAYPWIGDVHNLGWSRKPGMPFPFSPQGQSRYVRSVIRIVKSIPKGRGMGVWYWGGEYNATCPAFRRNPWAYRSLFNATGNALPAMRVLGQAARGGHS